MTPHAHRLTQSVNSLAHLFSHALVHYHFYSFTSYTLTPKQLNHSHASTYPPPNHSGPHAILPSFNHSSINTLTHSLIDPSINHLTHSHYFPHTPSIALTQSLDRQCLRRQVISPFWKWRFTTAAAPTLSFILDPSV